MGTPPVLPRVNILRVKIAKSQIVALVIMHVILVNGKPASLFSDKDADLVVKDCTVFNYTDPYHGSYADTIVFDNRTGNRYRPASKTETAVTICK